MKWKTGIREPFWDNVAQRDISTQNMECERVLKNWKIKIRSLKYI